MVVKGGKKKMDTRIVKFEVVIRLEGNGSVLGLPDVVGDEIKAAILRSEGEGTLSGEQTVASAHFESVTLMKDSVQSGKLCELTHKPNEIPQPNLIGNEIPYPFEGV